ncbi:MAG: thioredoxin family protein [Chitinispirillaceae bacterium]|nr:thioredoxin family protein [Chitinispirillaceae bacterium]
MIGAIVIGGILFVLIIIPRTMMAIISAGLKGKKAPTPHKPSAARIVSGKKTVLYFYTPPCGACKIQEPIMTRVKKIFPDAVFKIDASKNPEAARAYGVMGVPFLAFIADGKLASAKAGVQRESTILAFLS